MPENGRLEILTEGLELYVNTNSELIKLEVAQRSTAIGSSLVGGLLLGLAGMWALLFISLSVAFYISAQRGDIYSGFAIVAGFYFLVLIILWVGRKALIEIPLRDLMVRKVFDTSKN